MQIAVYTGSFDPLHIGHLAIMRRLSESFDVIYLIVSPQNPFKSPSKARNAEQRYEAALEAISRYPELRVRVDDIELRMSAPQYTIRTLDALRAREPQNEFTLVMGADNLKYIRGWREFSRILCDYGVVVYPRRGYDLDAIRSELLAENSRYKIKLIDAELFDVSSTQIREAEARGEDMSRLRM